MRIGGGVLLAVGLVAWVSTAWAGVVRGQDGGNTVTVGASNTASSPEHSLLPATPKSTGGAGPACTYSPIVLAETAGFDLAPGGPTAGEWYLVQCPGSVELEDGRAEWVPASTSGPTASSGTATGTPGVAAAAEAAASIALPSPSIEVNPAAFSIVNIATWLAVDPALWHAYRATATAGGVTATAVATPETVDWSMGDGGKVECAGPGAVYDPALPDDAQSTSCSYSYERSSQGQPSSDGNPNDGSFLVTATVSWAVTWTATGASGGGTLPPLQTTSNRALRVEQVESVGILP